MFCLQKRFITNGADGQEDVPAYRWWIPLSYTSQRNANFSATQPQEWIEETEDQKIVSIPANLNEWVVFNLQQTGYYRVNYDSNNWKALTSQLTWNHRLIPATNRAQMLDDILNLARSGILPILKLYYNKLQSFLPYFLALHQVTLSDNFCL